MDSWPWVHGRVVPAIVLASVTAACSGDSGAGASHVVRDSAGIQIVESAAPVWTEGAAWRIPPEPVLSIGELDGPVEYQFFRAITALRMPAGEIAVTNAGSFELRFYDLQGTFLRSVGREGGGPGEFARMSSVWRAGQDTLVLYDFGNNRVSVHGRDGSFARTMRLEQVAGVPLALGVFDDGSILAYWHLPADERAEGLGRTPRLYARWNPEGALADSHAVRPGSEFFSVSTGPESVMALSRPFGRSPVAVAGPTHWYYGSGDRYEIEVRAMDGTLERLIRRPVANRPVTQDLIEERERRVRENRAARGVTSSGPFDDVPYPAEMPAYGELLLDAGGNLWVQYYRLQEEPIRWGVFAPEGQWLGDVTAPPNGRITDIGDDFVLGIWRDDLDVQQVRMYRLLKDAG